MRVACIVCVEVGTHRPVSLCRTLLQSCRRKEKRKLRDTAKQHFPKAYDPNNMTSYSGEQVTTFIEIVVAV